MTTMTHKDEQISALMDGESSRFEIRRSVDLLLSDADLRERWGRYHLIGDVLRRDVKQIAAADFSAGVMARLAAEQDEAVSPRRAQSRWAKPLLGFAMAASVAGAMVIGLQSMMGPGQIGGDLMQQALPGNGFERVADVEPTADPGHHVPTQLESYMRMNSYLLSHAEQTGGQGMMPYVRMVSYTPAR
ncbi:sigma-E factor negative regulatory protein [Acidihalobacter prosperus]|uniref:Sigma factor RpoE negative regulatory protein RseA n=1 Tax=Acidihalobacter prosperus TaxID=160660 RepID=A0A1A6C773_9GAMM|nr:sigma-E factor negative regulatory protein [Acidihalobacter prosperus]OBS10399.1 Sigma factor RpoE negative regulatory protein RseA [Acidihalobacter prosperus]